jgi:DNA adenine methylase
MNDGIWIRRMQAEMGMPKPILKWAGGKRQLLAQLLPRMPEQWERYFEPFSGGLSVYFALYRNERIGKATLGDLNFDLMDTYRLIRSRPEMVMQFLRSWRHSRRKFEELRLVRRTSQWTPEDAARFIYLNRTCFNGLYRVNKKGEFNVPFGKYKNPTICDAENIEAVSEALQDVTLFTGPFEGCLREAKKGDFVYCDPPYAGVDFTAYTSAGFGPKEQKALADTLDCLSKKRVKWMLSNSDVAWVHKRYKKYNIEGVKARRNVNSKASGRGPVGEVIVRNYE